MAQQGSKMAQPPFKIFSLHERWKTKWYNLYVVFTVITWALLNFSAWEVMKLMLIIQGGPL